MRIEHDNEDKTIPLYKNKEKDDYVMNKKERQDRIYIY